MLSFNNGRFKTDSVIFCTKSGSYKRYTIKNCPNCKAPQILYGARDYCNCTNKITEKQYSEWWETYLKDPNQDEYAISFVRAFYPFLENTFITRLSTVKAIDYIQTHLVQK